MYVHEPSEDHRPMMWVRGYPLYAAHFIVVVFVASMLATTLAMATNMTGLLSGMSFTSGSVLGGEVWRIVTYGLVNPPSLWFVIDMFMIAWFGREVEKTFGRRSFLLLYGGLYTISPLLFTLLGLWTPMSIAGQPGGFGIFIAFTVLFPNVPFFFGILAKWIAAVLIGIYTLMHLSAHNGPELLSLWATVAFAFLFVKYQQGALTFPSMPLRRRRANLRVVPNVKAKQADEDEEPKETPMAEVDALLDKIAQFGIGSLTAKERAKLDAAREDLMKRGTRR